MVYSRNFALLILVLSDFVRPSFSKDEISGECTNIGYQYHLDILLLVLVIVLVGRILPGTKRLSLRFPPTKKGPQARRIVF